ncbi:hypothetical protein [Streptomyces sp. NPDC047141]|uniref:hypothetical protein n=1 Tax=Streptomyces sp. NPDC047141 TaxID=3155738 RepID=UPI0033DE1D97
MVSSPHEAMHSIFQHDPHPFHRLSDLLELALPATVEAIALTTDVTESRPVVTHMRLNGARDSPLLLAVAVQRKKDPTKPAAWAYSTTYLWAKYGLPTVLLVVCQDRATAEWAGQPVTLGPTDTPALALQPMAVGPHNMPVITDPAEARVDLALATLSAITHAGDPDIGAVLKALSTALRDVPENVAEPIIEFTARGLGNRQAEELWRNLVATDLSFYTSYLSEELRAEGRAEGRAQGSADALLMVMRQRGLDVPCDIRDRITSCRDPLTLRRWVARAVIAISTEEIFTTE